MFPLLYLRAWIWNETYRWSLWARKFWSYLFLGGLFCFLRVYICYLVFFPGLHLKLLVAEPSPLERSLNFPCDCSVYLVSTLDNPQCATLDSTIILGDKATSYGYISLVVSTQKMGDPERWHSPPPPEWQGVFIAGRPCAPLDCQQAECPAILLPVFPGGDKVLLKAHVGPDHWVYQIG